MKYHVINENGKTVTMFEDKISDFTEAYNDGRLFRSVEAYVEDHLSSFDNSLHFVVVEGASMFQNTETLAAVFQNHGDWLFCDIAEGEDYYRYRRAKAASV